MTTSRERTHREGNQSDEQSASARPPERNVAIFIDMENLFGGYSGDIGQVRITSILDDIRAALNRLGVGSAVAVTRAYANWADSRLGKYRREMMEHGVEPVQVFSFSTAVKNAADIEMVVDVLEVASGASHVNVFVLVSGDGGFVPLVRRLHTLGKYVMVATTEERAAQSTSKLLQAVADHFVVSGTVAPLMSADAETVGAELARDAGTAPIIPPVDLADQPSVDDVVALIKALLFPDGSASPSSVWTDQDGKVNGAALGSRVRQRWPNLSWRTLGYRSLGMLVKVHTGLDVQRQIAAAEPADVEDARNPTAALEHATADIESRVGIAARAALRDAIHSVVLRNFFKTGLTEAGGSMKLSPVGVLLKKELPADLKNWAGFSSLTFALRFCLAGTPYCVIETDDVARELLLASREDAEREHLMVLPDVFEEELGDPHTVWELARRATPPIVLVDPAIFRDVSEYMLEQRPTCNMVDLIDVVAEALPPYYEAVHIRGALNLLRRCSILIPGPADYVFFREDIVDGKQVQRIVRQELEACLDRHGWPKKPEAIDEMLGVGGEWN